MPGFWGGWLPSAPSSCSWRVSCCASFAAPNLRKTPRIKGTRRGRTQVQPKPARLKIGKAESLSHRDRRLAGVCTRTRNQEKNKEGRKAGKLKTARFLLSCLPH